MAGLIGFRAMQLTRADEGVQRVVHRTMVFRRLVWIISFIPEVSIATARCFFAAHFLDEDFGFLLLFDDIWYIIYLGNRENLVDEN